MQSKGRRNTNAHQMDKQKMWYTHTVEHHSALREKEILTHAATCMKLKDIILSEIRSCHKGKDITWLHFDEVPRAGKFLETESKMAVSRNWEKRMGVVGRGVEGGFPRWWRNRTRKPLSLPQIHQKIMWMLSNFHQTTSECWQRTPVTQKGNQLSSKGQNIKEKKRGKELGMETRPGEGVLKEEFPNSRKPSHRRICGQFWNLRGQHNQRWGGGKTHRICA